MPRRRRLAPGRTFDTRSPQADAQESGATLDRHAGASRLGSLPRRGGVADVRSEEHTSELHSQSNIVCRLLLEKKNLPRPPRIISSHALRRAHAAEIDAVLDNRHHVSAK